MLHRSQRCTLSGHPLPMSPLSLHPRSPSFALITEGQRECWPQTGNMGRGAHGVEGGNHHMPATIHLTNRSGAGCDHNSQQQLPTRSISRARCGVCPFSRPPPSSRGAAYPLPLTLCCGIHDIARVRP